MLDGLILQERDDLLKFILSIIVFATIFTLISVYAAEWIMPFRVQGINFGGIVAVFFATLALSYPLTDFLRSRDEKELKHNWKESNILFRHFEELMVYLGIFVATTIAFGIATYFINGDFFQVQELILEGIRGDMAVTGDITASAAFYSILLNNLGVFAMTFAVSFLIAGGMSFVIIWNASVVGVLIGNLASSIAEIPIQLLPYIVHGTVEIAAYVFAGFAGYLLAYHIEHYFKHGTHTECSFLKILGDSIVLVVLGVIFLVLAAMLETGYPVLA